MNTFSPQQQQKKTKQHDNNFMTLSHLKLFTDVDTNYNRCPYKKIVDK